MRVHLTPDEDFHLFSIKAEPVAPPVPPSDPVQRPVETPIRKYVWPVAPLRDPFADLHDLLVCHRS